MLHKLSGSLLFTTAALFFVACSGSDVSLGADDPSGTAGAGASDEPTASNGGSATGEAPKIAPCSPGLTTTAPDGCNTCTCSDNGTFACTEIACEDPTDPVECRGDAEIVAADGCNTCSCVEGFWACTRRACDPGSGGQSSGGQNAGGQSSGGQSSGGQNAGGQNNGGQGGGIGIGGQGGGIGIGGRGGGIGIGGKGGTGGAGSLPTECGELRTAYASAIQQARMCNPELDSLQCEETRNSSIDCGCPIIVNGPESVLDEIDALKVQWSKLGCIAEVCPAVLCLQPTVGTCSDSGQTTGTCIGNGVF